MSPTQRSLAKLRSEGWLVAVVEKWNPHVKIRQDLFGFGDLLAVQGGAVMIVQTTSGSNLAARLAKIKSCPGVSIWLESPTRLVAVHGWSKKGPRGKRKLWECREQMIRQADLLIPNCDAPY